MNCFDDIWVTSSVTNSNSHEQLCDDEGRDDVDIEEDDEDYEPLDLMRDDIDSDYNTEAENNNERNRQQEIIVAPVQQLVSTIKRLPDEDVRSIFESLHENKPIPSHLNFTIVPIGPIGLNLSPPPFEFPGKCNKESCIVFGFFNEFMLKTYV